MLWKKIWIAKFVSSSTPAVSNTQAACGPSEGHMRPANTGKNEDFKENIKPICLFFKSYFFLNFLMWPARPYFQTHAARETHWVWDLWSTLTLKRGIFPNLKPNTHKSEIFIFNASWILLKFWRYLINLNIFLIIAIYRDSNLKMHWNFRTDELARTRANEKWRWRRRKNAFFKLEKDIFPSRSLSHATKNIALYD